MCDVHNITKVSPGPTNFAARMYEYSDTSNFEHSPFQETVRLSSYSAFDLNIPN
jgi:hypothetical protein